MISRASNMGKDLSRFGTSVNPKSGRGAKKGRPDTQLHPKMGAQTMGDMKGRTKQTAAELCGERLKAAREALGVQTAKEFAERLGYNPQTYRNFERGNRQMGYEDLKTMADAGISLEWIIQGIGPMLTNVTTLRRPA
jgi:DNA-binding transcriptional regulator YiaG